MNVQYAAAKCRDEIRRQQAHETGEANQIDARIVERGDDHAIVGFALKSLRRDDARRDAALGGAVEPRGAFAIGDNERNLGIGNAACGYTLNERNEIRSAATQQHANTLGHKRRKLAHPRHTAKQPAREPSRERQQSAVGGYPPPPPPRFFCKCSSCAILSPTHAQVFNLRPLQTPFL